MIDESAEETQSEPDALQDLGSLDDAPQDLSALEEPEPISSEDDTDKDELQQETSPMQSALDDLISSARKSNSDPNMISGALDAEPEPLAEPEALKEPEPEPESEPEPASEPEIDDDLSPAERELQMLKAEEQKVKQEEAQEEPEPEPQVEKPKLVTGTDFHAEPDEVRKLREEAAKVKPRKMEDYSKYKQEIWEETWDDLGGVKKNGLWWKIIVIVVLLAGASAATYFMLFADGEQEKEKPALTEKQQPDSEALEKAEKIQPKKIEAKLPEEPEPTLAPLPGNDDKKKVAAAPEKEKPKKAAKLEPKKKSKKKKAPKQTKPKDPYKAAMDKARKQLNRRQLDKAMKTYQEALEAKPGASYAYLGISKVWLEKGDLNKSYEFSKKSVASSSRNHQAWLMLGTVCQYLGKGKEAKDAYETYLRLKPKGTTSNEIRAILESL